MVKKQDILCVATPPLAPLCVGSKIKSNGIWSVAYLGPCQTPMMDLFRKKDQRLS